jgi:hypothetical protein
MKQPSHAFPQQFDELLAFFRRPVCIDPSASRLELAWMGYRKRDTGLDLFTPTAIRIMESGIFHDGKLKGASLDAGSGKHYETHQIRDLPTFVMSLSMFFDVIERHYTLPNLTKSMISSFSSIDEHLNRLIPSTFRLAGKRKSNQLISIRKQITAIQNSILDRIDRPPRLPRSKIKHFVAYLFEEHTDAPNTVRAERASDLLNYLDIKSTPDSIRKKLPKKRTKGHTAPSSLHIF